MTKDAFLDIDDSMLSPIASVYIDRLHYILSQLTLATIAPLGRRQGIVAAMEYPQHWTVPMAWQVSDTIVYLSLPWRFSAERYVCGIIISLDMSKMDWNPTVVARRRDLMWFSCNQPLTDEDWDVVVAHYAPADKLRQWKTAHLEFTCAMLEKLRHAILWKGEGQVATVPQNWVDFLLMPINGSPMPEIGQAICDDGDVRVIVRCRGKIFVIKNRQAMAVRFDGANVIPTPVDSAHYRVLLGLREIDSYYTPPLLQVEEISL